MVRVTPQVGVWIEILITLVLIVTRIVTPQVGVWIEIGQAAENVYVASKSLLK